MADPDAEMAAMWAQIEAEKNKKPDAAVAAAMVCAAEEFFDLLCRVLVDVYACSLFCCACCCSRNRTL